MHYYASYVPLIRETEILGWDPSSRPKATAIKVTSAFELKSLLKPGDHLWLMMGSTNAAMALAAFRKEVIVHQLSLPRLSSWLKNSQIEEENTDKGGQVRLKVTANHVFRVAQGAPELFYTMNLAQAEVLEIAAVWQRVKEAMEARKSAANLLRNRVYEEAVVFGKVGEKQLPTDPKEAEERLKKILSDLLGTKDEQGRKRRPSDPHIAFLVEAEDRERARLEAICSGNAFYQHLFGDIEGVGSMIGARFIAAIERIERFARPEDLSNYAGMLPRGREGHLPCKRSSKGQTLSRSPQLNSACFLLQDFMFQWGRNTKLGQMLHQQVQRDCPCTQAQRNKDKELRRRHVAAVKQARIAMARHFLEAIIWPRWQEYMGLTS